MALVNNWQCYLLNRLRLILNKWIKHKIQRGVSIFKMINNSIINRLNSIKLIKKVIDLNNILKIINKIINSNILNNKKIYRKGFFLSVSSKNFIKTNIYNNMMKD
jgi:hypothetical protein